MFFVLWQNQGLLLVSIILEPGSTTEPLFVYFVLFLFLFNEDC